MAVDAVAAGQGPGIARGGALLGNDANEHRRRAEEHLRRADQHPRSAQRWNRIALWGSGCVLVLYGIAGLLLLAAVVMVVLALCG